MGQRTQVLVVKENLKGEKKVFLFHHQWGYGRTMFLGLMDLFLQDYNSCSEIDRNFLGSCNFKTFSRRNCFYHINKDIPRKILKAVDLSNLDTIRAVFDYCDNNNGGMVVHIKELDKYSYSSFKVGFLLGSEDAESEFEGKIYNKGNGDAFERWLTPKEYGQMNGGSPYSDPKFTKMFDAFCKYFNMTYFK